MTSHALFEPALSGRLCLTLLHSIWQVSFLVLAVRLINLRKRSVEFEYAAHLAALVLAILALPLTFVIVDRPRASALVNPFDLASVDSDLLEHEREVVLPESPPHSSETSIAANASSQRGRLAMDARSPWANWRDWAPWLFTLYTAGASIMLVRLGVSIVRAEQLRRRAHLVTSGPGVESLRTLSNQWSMRIMPIIAWTDSVALPKVVGLLRPTILLPAAALVGLSASELEMILIHELAHVRRFDLWANLLQRLFEVVLFFNPAAWYLNQKINSVREYCCDETTCRALKGHGTEPRLLYVAALIRVVELAMPHKAWCGDLTALAASGRSPSELRRRVARILGDPLHDPIPLSRGGMLALGTVALLATCGPFQSVTEAQPIEAQTTIPKGNEKADQAAIKAFSFGGKVEVLAIGSHNDQPQQWWDIEGHPLATVPFTWKGDLATKPGDLLYLKVVFRIHDYPDDAHINWFIPPSQMTWDGQITIDDKQPPGYFTRYFGVAKDLLTAGLKIGVATGKWTKTVACSGQGAFNANGLNIVFSEPLQTATGTTVIVSHDCFEQDFRVVAVDKQGNVHPRIGYGGSSAGRVYQSKADFPNLVLADIDHFEFQTRSYEWIEFENLPLKPSMSVSMSPAVEQPKQVLTFSGRVVDSTSKPIAMAKVWARWPFFEDWTPIAASDSEGQFGTTIDRKKLDEQLQKNPHAKSFRLWATAEGYGRVLTTFDPRSPKQRLTFVLPPEHPINGQILTSDGQPVAGVPLRFIDTEQTGTDQVDQYLKELPGKKGLKAFHPEGMWKQMIGPVDSPIGPKIVTDREGRFRVNGIGPERVVVMEIESPGLANDTVSIVTRTAPPATPANGIAVSNPRPYESAFYSQFIYFGAPGRTIRGVVRDKDTHQPLAGIRIATFTNHSQFLYTDDQGRFEATGFHKADEYELQFRPLKLPYFGDRLRVKGTSTFEPIDVEVNLFRGKLLKGKTVDTETGQPVRGDIEYSPLFGNSYGQTLLPGTIDPVSQCHSQEDGSFEIAVLPGPGIIRARALSNQGRFRLARLERSKIEALVRTSDLKPSDGPFVDFLPLAWGGKFHVLGSVLPYQSVAIINPTENETLQPLTLEFVPGITRIGRLVDKNGRPVAGARFLGLEDQSSVTPEPLKSSTFNIMGLDPRRPRPVIAWHHELKLGGMIFVDGSTTGDVILETKPCGTVIGRLLNHNGEPLTNFNAEVKPKPIMLSGFGWWQCSTTTDGRFRIEGLVADCPFNLKIAPRHMHPANLVAEFKIQPGETKDLGDIVVREKYGSLIRQAAVCP